MTMQRLLWILALISICWVVLVIAPHWSADPGPPPWFWGQFHKECRDRLAFWPDGTRMGDFDLNPYFNEAIDRERRQLTDREQWAYDVQKKVAACEDAEWRPIGIQEQRRELLGWALVPPAILFLVGAAIPFGLKHFGETVPRHIRRGLIRLYILVAVPWIAWFGYMAYAKFPGAAFERAILALPVVPVGALILYFVVLWIAAGFRKRAEDKADQT